MSGAAFDLITGRASAVPQVILAFTFAPQPLLQEIQMRWREGKGKEFKREVAEFGEAVLYLKLGTKGRDKLDSRWETGIWMGIKDQTGECIIGTSEGTVKARDFKKIADTTKRWNVGGDDQI